MINFKDFQKNLHEDVEQLEETPVTKVKQPHRPGSVDPATGKTRSAPEGTYAADKAKRVKKEELVGDQDKLDVDKDGKIEKSDLKKLRKGKEDIVVNKGENVKEEQGCSKKSFREFVEELEEAKKDDYWDFKDLKDEPKSTTRKIAGKAYGGAAQKDDDDEDDKPAAKPTEKRGRGRPAGSKSGARTAGNGKQYGGLTIHSLNLPSKK